MRRTVLLIILSIAISFFLSPVSSWARGGGGCLEEGTPVLTPKGPVAVEKLKRGDPVWSFRAGRIERAEVQAKMEVRPAEYLEISTSAGKLVVTPEHPVMVADGEYRAAGFLNASDTVYRVRNGAIGPVAVESVRRVAGERPAYNLIVHPGGTFLAGGIVVHNKGCFLPESRILKADGTELPISAVRPGDDLLAFSLEGRMVRTRVREIVSLAADEYFLLKTDQTTLRVTSEHPFYIGHGTYKTVEALKEGDSVVAWNGRWLSEQRIVSLKSVHEKVEVFNLQTDNPNTFFAGRIAVHNKGGGGGCFPAGTKVTTPDGRVAIETLAAGDEVLSVTHDGITLRTTVKDIFISKNRLLKIEAGGRTLVATEEHPVSVGAEKFRPAGELRRGDRIMRWKNGRLATTAVRRIRPGETDEMVFNLQVGEPNTFIAEGIVVHNKGGGGSSHSSSHSNSSSSSSGGGGGEMTLGVFLTVLAIVFVFPILILVLIMRSKKSSKAENLDFVYARSKVVPKAGKTENLLIFLGGQDPSVKPESLRKLTDSTFRKLQECWQARRYEPMKSLLMPNLFNEHTAQLNRMIANREINRIEDLKVESIDLVNVRYTERPDRREFTGLVTASAKDYYVDDGTGKFLRGDKAPARFQEFWTFQFFGGQWLLREIEQSGESDLLKEANFVETLTDDTLRGIYGETAKKKGEAGPWLEKETEEKATRIDRLLNFLVQTDKLWDRNQMLERARQTFMDVYLARESGNPEKIPASDLFPAVAESLRNQLKRWQADGIKVEYRNICVRKTELLLVRNFADDTKDEYTVRISAHAQRIIRKGGEVESDQEYVTPFEEYWTFGRLDKQWKLKEVLPPGSGKKKIGLENVDQDSSPDQLQWYYRQPRAT